MAGDANRKSYEAVERWYRAQQSLQSAKQRVNGAECDLLNAQNALGKHLCPPDAEVGEEFAMWIHTEDLGMVEKERVLLVTKTGEHDYSIKWREPRKAKPIKAVA